MHQVRLRGRVLRVYDRGGSRGSFYIWAAEFEEDKIPFIKPHGRVARDAMQAGVYSRANREMKDEEPYPTLEWSVASSLMCLDRGFSWA